MIYRFIPAVIAFGLLACAGIQTQPQKIDATCASTIAALRVVKLGVEQGKVSEAQQRDAVAAGEIIAPICSASERPTLDAIKRSAFEQAAARILTIAAGAQ